MANMRYRPRRNIVVLGLISLLFFLLCIVLPFLLRSASRPPFLISRHPSSLALVAALQSGSSYAWEGRAEDVPVVWALLPMAARALELEGVTGECVGVRARAEPYLIDPTLALAPTLASGLSNLSTVPEFVRLRWLDNIALFYVVPRTAPHSPTEYQTTLPAVFLSPLTFAALSPGYGILYSRSGAWAAFTPSMEHAGLVRALVAQAVCSLTNARVGFFSAPLTFNVSEPTDFADDAAAFFLIKEFLHCLRSWVLKTAKHCLSLTTGELLVSAYEELLNGGLVRVNIVLEARAWVLQLKGAGEILYTPAPCVRLDETAAVLSPPRPLRTLPIHAAVYVSMVSSNVAPWVALYGSSFESFSFYQELHPQQLLTGHLPPPVYPGHELALETFGVPQWGMAYRAFLRSWDAICKQDSSQQPAGVLFAHDDMHLDFTLLSNFMDDATKCVLYNGATNCPAEGLPNSLCSEPARIEDLTFPDISRVCRSNGKVLSNTSWWVGQADWVLVKTSIGCAEGAAQFVAQLRAFEGRLRNLERALPTTINCAFASSQISVTPLCTTFDGARLNPSWYINAVLQSDCGAVHPLKLQHSTALLAAIYLRDFFRTFVRGT